MGGDRVYTYSLEAESGASLRGAGFERDAEVRAERWNRQSRPRCARAIECVPKVRWSAPLPEIPA